MGVKEYLRDIRRLDSIIKMKKIEIDRISAMAEYKGVSMDPNRGGAVKGGKAGRTSEDLIVKMIDLKEELNESIGRLIDYKKKGLEMIDSLSDPKMVEIFYNRYFLFMKWEEIADNVGVTFQWIHELHKKGLKELSKKFPNV